MHGWFRSAGLLATIAAGGLVIAAASAQEKPSSSSNLDNQYNQKKAGAFALTRYQIVERQANTFTANHQEGTVLDVDSKGNVLVAWGSRRQEQGTFGIFAQRFDPLGRPLGTEIRVNQFAPNTQENPAIAFDPNDRAWVAWMSFNQDGYTEDGSEVVHAGQGEIYARRFGAGCDGSFGPKGDEFRVNETVRGHQELASVTVNNDGRALFTWTSNTDDGKKIVMGRMFNADGSAATGEFKLSHCSTSSFRDMLASAAALPDGRFATIWARANAQGDPVGLIARLFNADGSAAGEEITVNADDNKVSIEPSIDVDASGRFVVAWMGQREDGAYDVLARQFDATGTALGDVLVVSNDDVRWKNGASVAVAPDGRFAVSWNVFSPMPDEITMKPKAPARMMAKVYGADGSALTPEAFQVNQFNEGQQKLDVANNARRMAWSGLDQLAFAWNGRTPEDKSAAAFTLLAPRSLDIPAPPAVEAVAAAANMSPDEVVDPRALIPPVHDPNSVVFADPVMSQPAGPDFGFTGFNDTGWTPPDPDIAAGPNHVVIVVNGGIRFYKKDGTLTHAETINQFWSEVGSQNFVFDPVAVYDHWSDRFFVGAAEHVGNSGFIDLAVSDDNDPNGTWHKYRFNTTTIGGFIDFPNLGVGPDAIYVATDYFSQPTGNHIQIFDKAKMLNGDPVTLIDVKTSSSFRSLGSTNDYDDDGISYFMTAFSGSSNRITIDSIRNPLGTPIRNTINITVPSFGSPPDARQKGSSALLDTIDVRTKNGVVRNGHLWTTHSIGEGGVARVRWYEFDLKGWPASGQNPVLVQSGTFDLGSGQYSWMADIGVDQIGNAIIAFSRSSTNDFAYVARSIRFIGDPAGEFQTPVTMVDGQGTDSSGRWGDFAGVDEDPAEPGTFWSHNEYPGTGNNNWKTWVGQVAVSAGMQLVVDQVIVGQNTTLDVTGAKSGETVYFAYSLKGEGATFVPFLNVTLDIRKPKLINTVVADASGRASLVVKIPSGAPVGRPIWFQAAAFESKSNFPRFIISN